MVLSWVLTEGCDSPQSLLSSGKCQNSVVDGPSGIEVQNWTKTASKLALFITFPNATSGKGH